MQNAKLRCKIAYAILFRTYYLFTITYYLKKGGRTDESERNMQKR